MTDHPTSLRAAREDTIDALCAQFARDALSLGELESRLARAREARTRDELRALLSDLAAPTPPVPAQKATPAARPSPRPAHPAGAGEVRPSSSLAFAVMGGTRRAGRWVPPDTMLAMAIMGSVELDFRDAVLSAGVTDITCFAFWGGVEITVPPDVHVDTRGFALMGGFEQATDVASEPQPGAPVIRVNGFALMGGVEVKVRERGEKGRGRRNLQRRIEPAE